MMTPFEKELLETAWPYIWTGMITGITLFIKSKAKEQATRLASICSSLKAFQEDVVRIEKAMATDRADKQHRLDVLIGESNARLSALEAGCDLLHGSGRNRRASDKHDVHWAQASDIKGDKTR